MASQSPGAVIVNYNAGHHLVDCIGSLEAEGVRDIVVVDNGSIDGSFDEVKAKFPEVKTVSLAHNPGYGTAMNAGVELLGNESIFLLNPDTVLAPGAIDVLNDVLARDSGLAMVGPRLEDSDTTLYPSARRFPSFVDAVGHAVLGIVWSSNRWSRRYKMLDWDHESAREVDWVSGAAMFCRRRAFLEVAGFDESYFMYMEDVDLCWRLRKVGWRIAYDPAATVMHVRGVSTDPTPYRFIVAHHRSLLRYNLRTASGMSRAFLPFVVAGLAVRVPLACAHRFLTGKKAASGAKRTARAASSH